jgi:aromatase
MACHTDNSILIDAPREFVFGLTNDLQVWTRMFTEYERVEVVKPGDPCFEFRLTTRADDDGEVHTWLSERCVHREQFRTESHRIEPLVPFASMKIVWTYETDGDGTVLRFVQDFTIAAGLPYSDEQGEDFINANTRPELESIKAFVEGEWSRSRAAGVGA